MAARVLTEKKLKGNLVILGVLVFLSLALLFAAAFFIYESLERVQITSIDSMTAARANEMVQEMSRHVGSDLRTLRLLAMFFDTARQLRPNEEISVSMHALLSAMQRLNFSSDFLTISWYRVGGEGFRADLATGEVNRVFLSSDTAIVQEVVSSAFAGNETVSSFHFDPSLQRRIMLYAQPFRLDGRVIGVVLGTHGAGELQNILETAVDADSQYSLFIVDDRGSFIATASAGGFPEIINYTQGVETLALPVIPPETRSQMQNTRDGFIRLRQAGVEYHGFVQSFSFGSLDTRVVCINTDANSASITSRQLFVTRSVFTVFCGFVIISVIFGTALTYSYGARLVRFLFFDELTGADNANRFRRKLSERLDKAADRREGICVATLNIRQFRSITEIFGTGSGNNLLRIVKQVLEKNLEKDEFFCRAANDIFHVGMRESDEGAIRKRIEDIMDEVARTYQKTHDYHVKMYAGVVVVEAASIDETSVSDIFLHLSLALAQAKADVSETVCFYEEKLYEQEETQSYIETHMDTALADGSFKLYLQPKMDLATGTIGGAEALVRWSANEGERMIYPDQFIPFFNLNGFCVKLDMYMLEQACKQMREWIDAGIEPVPISVNQSRLLFFEADYVDNVSSIAAKYSIPPGIITLEILEEMYLERADEVNTKVAELRKRGFLISMDDFGSGYSSFSAIGELSVDELKLDRKFLMTASGTENWRMKIVIDQVVRMARRLHLSVVAEGVETKEDEQLIKTLGCDYGQGYYYSKPISVEEFNERYMHVSQGDVEFDVDKPFPPELL